MAPAHGRRTHPRLMPSDRAAAASVSENSGAWDMVEPGAGCFGGGAPVNERASRTQTGQRRGW